MHYKNLYIEPDLFKEIWDDRYVEGSLDSIQAIDGSMASSYIIVLGKPDGVVEEKEGNIYTYTTSQEIKVIKAFVSGSGKYYKQYILTPS